MMQVSASLLANFRAQHAEASRMIAALEADEVDGLPLAKAGLILAKLKTTRAGFAKAIADAEALTRRAKD